MSDAVAEAEEVLEKSENKKAALKSGLRKFILIVEDEQDMIELYNSYLELEFDEMVRVIEAKDGLEATQKLPFQAFDLIITDLNMPKKSGQAFLRAIESSQMNNETPTIVISGLEDPKINVEKQHFLAKPVNQEQFIRSVYNQLKIGRDSNRVGACLVNAFIEAASYFLNKKLDYYPEQKEPIPIKVGDDVKGDYFRIFEVKDESKVNKFAFGFDESILRELAEKMEVEPDEEGIRRILKAAADTLAKHCTEHVGAEKLKVLNQRTAKNGDEVYQTLVQERGIEIPLVSEQGTLYICALWKKDKKKK